MTREQITQLIRNALEQHAATLDLGEYGGRDLAECPDWYALTKLEISGDTYAHLMDIFAENHPRWFTSFQVDAVIMYCSHLALDSRTAKGIGAQIRYDIFLEHNETGIRVEVFAPDTAFLTSGAYVGDHVRTSGERIPHFSELATLGGTQTASAEATSATDQWFPRSSQ